MHRFGYGNYVAQSTRTKPKLHPAGYLENRSVNPAYILGISPWSDDLDRHTGLALFGKYVRSRFLTTAADLPSIRPLSNPLRNVTLIALLL